VRPEVSAPEMGCGTSSILKNRQWLNFGGVGVSHNRGGRCILVLESFSRRYSPYEELVLEERMIINIPLIRDPDQEDGPFPLPYTNYNL
jgi:hypothetical protein